MHVYRLSQCTLSETLPKRETQRNESCFKITECLISNVLVRMHDGLLVSMLDGQPVEQRFKSPRKQVTLSQVLLRFGPRTMIRHVLNSYGLNYELEILEIIN